MGAKVYELRPNADRYRVSATELVRTEQDLRELHRERDTIALVVEERLLMLRVLAAIADGHADPCGLAEETVRLLDRASDR